MFNDAGATVVHKRMSFLSVSVISLTAVVIVTVLSGVGIVGYGMHVFDKKADTLVALVGQAAKALPEIRQSLPPALADAMDDERRPDYAKNLDISVRLAKSHDGDRDPSRRQRAVVEVKNNGDQMVTLLSMRLVATDEDGDVIAEVPTWAATPLQIEDDWRGPLLPHETRRLGVWGQFHDKATNVSCEVTDIRVWRADSGETAMAAAE